MTRELFDYAKEHHVPILCEDGLQFLESLIQKHQVKHILEIGTAIGYSALAMASLGCEVDTIEKDEAMYNLALSFMKTHDLKKRVHLIHADALHYQGDLGSYDLIFIDAAKAQYRKFFEKYTPYLKPHGLVVCDNLRFHDLKPENVNRHTKQLLKKIESFKVYLKENEMFITEFFDHGDGMSVSQRIEK